MPKAKPKVEHTCRQCGATFFEHLSQGRMFCSRECSVRSRGYNAEFVCAECGRIFVDGASQNRKYCSQQCRYPFNEVHVEEGIAYIELKDRRRRVVAHTAVSVRDLERIRALGCRVTPAWVTKRQEYRATVEVDGNTCALARFIVEAWKYPGSEVDHRDGDALHNTRGNLRVTTKTKNMQNRKGATKLSGTGKRNVYFNDRKGKYQVKMQVDGKPLHVGYFDNLEEADEAAISARRTHMTHSEK